MTNTLEKGRIYEMLKYAEGQETNLMMRLSVIINNPFYRRCGNEDKAQMFVSAYMAWRYPSVFWYHTENEGKRSPAQKYLTKHNGLKAGVPDVMIFVRGIINKRSYAGMALELKILPNKETANQAGVLEKLINCNWFSMVVSGASVDELFFAVKEILDAFLGKVPTDIEMLEGATQYRKTKIGHELIISTISEYFDITYEQMTSKTRIREISYARQIAMYFIRRLSGYSLAMAGGLFQRDHATVLHAERTIKNLYQVDKKIEHDVNELLTRLG